jgi:hypothetical protein
MKKLLTILAFIFLLLPLTSASIGDLGSVKQGQCITIPQTCATCTYNDILSIIGPDKMPILSGSYAMTKVGMNYNFTFCNTSLVGTPYLVSGVGDLDGSPHGFTYIFGVTATGSAISLQETLIYFALLLVFGVLLVILVNKMFTSSTTSAKISYFDISYLTFIVLSFLIYRIVNDYLVDSGYLASILYYVFLISMIGLLPVILISIAMLLQASTMEKRQIKLMNMGYSQDEARKRS